MTVEPSEWTVMPPAASLDNLVELFANPRADTALVGPTGERVSLPAEVAQVLALVIDAMARGQAVTVLPHNQTLTTQEAADLLGVSRPTVVRILDQGLIPYRQPGRHRRILLRDVLTYIEEQAHRRRAALDELIEIGEEAGMYEATATPRRTR